MATRYRPLVSRGPHKLHIADPARPGKALCGYRGLPVGTGATNQPGVCKRCVKADEKETTDA